MLFKACSGPNLEVSVETSTTNLQQEAGMGGLFDWGQAGQIDYKKQIIKVVSLEGDDIEIYNVIINKGNCKSSFDGRVQSAVNSFYKQFERAEGAFFICVMMSILKQIKGLLLIAIYTISYHLHTLIFCGKYKRESRKRIV